MLTVIDRYILRSLLINYLIALGSMLTLYVVLDMFVNMDEFTEHGYPLLTVLGNIVGYYAPNLLLYFSQLCGAITLFACMATLARMRRLNELTAVLASGVSLFRVARPIIIFGVATTTLLAIDTELLIPAVAHKLARDHDDADGTRAYQILFLKDRDGALMSAAQFHPIDHDLRHMLVLKRNAEGDFASMLEADRATWEPPGISRPVGAWKLERGRLTTRVKTPQTGLGPTIDQTVTRAMTYVSDVSPEVIQIRQSEGWTRFLSLSQLAELKDRGGFNVVEIVRTMHQRRTQPIISFVLLMLGLPFFLNRSPANILSDTGRAMTACGLCYIVTFVAQTLRPDSASALPAWMPIFIFGTLSIVLIDRIKT